MTFDDRYRAISARDRRFDGQFITAVRSTGIYCRPSCPARTPKRSNVTFFATSAAAHEAGFRACRRCLPEATPGSPAWNVRGDVAARAMRLIADGAVEREGVSGLAAQLGYSSRHLGRVLAAEFGAGPLALARAYRAQTARALLVGTDLPIGDIAFSSGFASVRQFNDTVREIYGMTPSDVRTRRRAGERVSSGVSLTLPYRDPLDTEGIFAWMREREIAGVEEANAASFARTVRLPRGAGWFRVAPRGSGLALEAHVEHLADLGSLIARVRVVFDLDADPMAVDAALSAHSELAPLVARVPGIRVPGATEPFEMLVRAMVGQQISVTAARTHLGRLAAALGDRVEIAGESRIMFPSPAAISARGRDVLSGPRRRIEAIIGVAEAAADGVLPLSFADDSTEQREALLAMPGIGPWTADYVRMRVVRDPDVILPSDLALRRGAGLVGVPSTAPELAAWARRAAPWRSYLSTHLWRAATDIPEVFS